MALARCRDELLRRIDRRDGCRFEASNEFRRQRPRTAADVEHPLAGRNLGKVHERRRKPNGIPAHEAVVSVGIAGKAHAINPRLDQTSAVVPSSTEY